MPQANTIDLEAFEPSKSNLDLISDRPRRDHYYPPPSSSYSRADRHRERTYSLPTRSSEISYQGSAHGQRGNHAEDGGVDVDPVERMRRNLERTTFLLSNLKVTLSSKPEEIRILPPLSASNSNSSSTSSNGRHDTPAPGTMARHHSEPQKHSSSYYDSHPPPPRSFTRQLTRHGGSHLVAPGIERSDSNASNTTGFSIDVSTYSGEGRPQPEDHGSEFHQIINHGRLHNPSRGSMLRRQVVTSTFAPHPTSTLRARQPTSPEKAVEDLHGLRVASEKANMHTLSRHPTPYPAHSTSPLVVRDLNHAEGEPSVRSRPFPTSQLPHGHAHAHGRSVSVSHPIGHAAGGRKIPGMRRVRFEF